MNSARVLTVNPLPTRHPVNANSISAICSGEIDEGAEE
jgi:hypothetical protein